MALYTIFRAASYFLHLISTCIFIYCILTWVAPRSAARYWMERFVNPFCAPFRGLARKLSARWGSPFDFTCWFAMIAIEIAGSLLWYVYDLLIRILY